MKRISLIVLSIITLAIAFTSCQSDINHASSSLSDSYSSAEAEYDEDKRKVVKTANISLKVDHLEKAIINLKTFLKPIKGYVYNYEINNETYKEDSYQKTIDSSVVVEKIVAQGKLSVRVPIAKADSFINYVLNSNATISSLQIHDDDITENLWEKKEVANVYSKSGKAQHRKGNSKNIYYDNNTSMNAIKAKALAAKMNYKTKYLWFDIQMTAAPYYKSATTISAKNYRTPLHIGFANAAVKGWHICSDIILALVTVWPILLLIGLGLFFVRKYHLKTA